jgi:hypothetical protein
VTASFSRYDSRNYRTLDVVAGYAVWAPCYDATMDDRLDLPLLRSLVSVDWAVLLRLSIWAAVPGGLVNG